MDGETEYSCEVDGCGVDGWNFVGMTDVCM
jgi:hypothetical protein